MGTNKLSIKSTSKAILIAPCGMNCALCIANQRTKNHCPGCRIEDEHKAFSCINCRIKNCVNLKNSGRKFCYQCNKFPCTRLKQLDKRYRTKYNMSMIENLENIRKFGLRKFVVNENKKWACLKCGGVICIHKHRCTNCSN